MCGTALPSSAGLGCEQNDRFGSGAMAHIGNQGVAIGAKVDG
jgi:hypothetical protein